MNPLAILSLLSDLYVQDSENARKIAELEAKVKELEAKETPDATPV
jgi:hypothetical protein